MISRSGDKIYNLFSQTHITHVTHTYHNNVDFDFNVLIWIWFVAQSLNNWWSGANPDSKPEQKRKTSNHQIQKIPQIYVYAEKVPPTIGGGFFVLLKKWPYVYHHFDKMYAYTQPTYNVCIALG